MARILLIEAEANIRLLCRLELALEGHEIIDAGSGAEALRLLESETIDAVVLDLWLPDYHGLQLMEEILERQQHMPIIIHSAFDHFRDDFRSWGADAYVVKSSDLSSLKEALASVVPAPPKLLQEYRTPLVPD